jgi:hypothetical protein
MSQEIFDFRIAKLQRYIRRCHKEGRPVPSVYSPIEHDLSEKNVRTWLEQRDRKTENLKDVIRHIAAQPDDTEFMVV